MSRVLLSLLLVLSTFTTATARSFARPPDAPAKHTPSIDRTKLRAKLRAQRLANLERFRAYQRRGVFPNNTLTSGALNVWLDDQGHLCAAATIIRASGETALVDRIAREHNFIRLADVTSGPLMDWILTSGLTQDELVAIQKPFMGVGRPNPELTGPVIVVDADRRAAEDARLARLYRQVEARIVRDQERSLDLAVERLARQPALAAALLAI